MITTSQNQNIKTIDSCTLKQLLDNQEVTLIDVREPAEYARERMTEARLIPLSNFEASQLPTTDNKTLVFYCQSSNRSHQAAQKLVTIGLKEVIHLEGGLNAWKALGYPTQINKNAPIHIMRQVQIVAGTLVFSGTILGAFVSPWFLLLSGFVGAGLIFAGVSGTCAMANLLMKLPYNQRLK